MFKMFKAVQTPTSVPRSRGRMKEGLSRCFVTNDFDVVAIRIEDEGTIVV